MDSVPSAVDRDPMTEPAVGFGPSRGLLLAGLAAGLAAAAGAALVIEPTDRLVLAAVAAVLLGLAGVGLRIGRRLTVDAHGVVVRGATTSRTISWARILRVTAPSRRRMGIASTTLEIELTDDELLLFGRIDLGADPEQVAAALQARRPR